LPIPSQLVAVKALRCSRRRLPLLFVRWMQRATGPEPIADSPSDERGDEAL
jgi:hypothetical protein